MTVQTLEEQLIWLLNVSRNMLATRDLPQLLELVTDSFIEATAAERAFILLRDRETGVLVQRLDRNKASETLSHSSNLVLGVAKRTFSEGRAVFETKDGQGDGEDSVVVCIPLKTEAETLGVLYSDGPRGAGIEDSPERRRPATMLADHAAAAIENAKLFERANNDPLTGLPNSSYFLVELAKAMRAARTGSEGGLVLLDLDSFKRVNSAGGAEAGDQALVDIAGTLQELLRADGLVARYGSDKFAILLPPDPALSIQVRVRDVAERARASVAAKTYHGVTLSACLGGISFAQDTAESAPDLVAMADDALACARNRGESEVEIV